MNLSEVLMIACGVLAFTFAVDFGVWTPWYRHPLGWTVFSYALGMVLLLLLIISAVVFDGGVGEAVRVVVLSLIGASLVGKIAILHTERNLGRELTPPETFRRSPMSSFTQWFTTERRQQIQVFLGSLAPILILFGYGTEAVWEQVLIIAGAALQFLASITSLVNLKGQDVWSVLRGAIYTAAFTVSPALVLLGVYGEDVNATILTAVSLGLSSLSSLVAVFWSGHQRQDGTLRR